jgi:hypothetical protein
MAWYILPTDYRRGSARWTPRVLRPAMRSSDSLQTGLDERARGDIRIGDSQISGRRTVPLHHMPSSVSPLESGDRHHPSSTSMLTTHPSPAARDSHSPARMMCSPRLHQTRAPKHCPYADSLVAKVRAGQVSVQMLACASARRCMDRLCHLAGRMVCTTPAERVSIWREGVDKKVRREGVIMVLLYRCPQQCRTRLAPICHVLDYSPGAYSAARTTALFGRAA